MIAAAPAWQYRSRHIPGAFAAWRGDYRGDEGAGYPYGGMVAGPDKFQAFARGLSISNASTVAVPCDRLFPTAA